MTNVTKAAIPFIIALLSVIYPFFLGGFFFGGRTTATTVLSRLDSSFYRSINKDSLQKWKDESFKETNAYVIQITNHWNRTHGSFDYSTHFNCEEYDFFEAASLSKTVFAMISHRNAIPRIKEKELREQYFRLLQHSSGMENKSKCEFHYSDSGYLKAGELYRKIVGNSFEKDVPAALPFVWKPHFKGVNGYIRNDTLFRRLEKADTALPNGSLYLNFNNSQEFSQLVALWGTEIYSDFEKHKLEDVGKKASTAICGFQKLSWLNGIGLDESLGRPILFQWGCNWCYNHVLLIDVERQQSVLILTNSIIGAHEISQFTEKFYGKRLELLNYIGWW
jgi:hypothetical protein